MSSGGGDDDESIETPTLDATIARVRHQISVGEMPSTAQLMAAMKANPFEANFAEANRRMSGTDSSPSSGNPPRPNPLIITTQDDSDSQQPPYSQGGVGRKVSRKSSIGSGLSLKLPPPTLTSQSPGLFSNVGILEDPGSDPNAMGTPEIARLVKQVREDRISRVPGTAEVLDSVLTIETSNDGHITDPKLEQDRDEACRRASSPPAIGSGPNGGSGGTESGSSSSMVDLGQMGSGPPDEPPSINASGLGGEVVGGAQEGYFLQLRVGNQMMRIPFDVALAGKDGAERAERAGRGLLDAENSQDSDMGNLSRSWGGSQARLTPNMGGDRSGASSRGVSPVNPKIKTEGGSRGGRSSSLAVNHNSFCGATSDGGNDTDEKRKDTLERNKAAAIRYRKRKKEELVLMQDKVRKVEEEKFELQTQVTVLKRELERVGKKLDVHRGCNCPCEAKAKLEGLEGAGLGAHMGLGPGAGSMPYILQPVMLPHTTANSHHLSNHHSANLQLLNFVLPPKVSPLSQASHSPHLPSNP